jgi:hypothetical protein
MNVTDRLAALGPEQRRALFEKLQEKGLRDGCTNRTAPPIPRVPREDPFEIISSVRLCSRHDSVSRYDT